MPLLLATIITHNTHAQGGRKTHVVRMDTGKILCGTVRWLHYVIPLKVTIDWLNQPDPDGEICLRCKCAAIKIINQNK